MYRIRHEKASPSAAARTAYVRAQKHFFECFQHHKYDYKEGDYHELELGADQFDLVIFGQIIHREGQDKEES